MWKTQGWRGLKCIFQKLLNSGTHAQDLTEITIYNMLHIYYQRHTNTPLSINIPIFFLDFVRFSLRFQWKRFLVDDLDSFKLIFKINDEKRFPQSHLNENLKKGGYTQHPVLRPLSNACAQLYGGIIFRKCASNPL